MNNDMSVFRPGGGLQRQVRRELDRIVAETGVERARVQARGEVEAARTQAVGSLVGDAQMATVEVAQVTELLAQRCPRVAGQLAATEKLGGVLILQTMIQGAHRIGSL